MPLVFPVKMVGTVPQYTAVDLLEAVFDFQSKRLLLRVCYGDVVASKFVRNKQVPCKVHVLEGSAWIAVLQAMQSGNVRSVVWQQLKNMNAEEGSEV